MFGRVLDSPNKSTFSIHIDLVSWFDMNQIHACIFLHKLAKCFSFAYDRSVSFTILNLVIAILILTRERLFIKK